LSTLRDVLRRTEQLEEIELRCNITLEDHQPREKQVADFAELFTLSKLRVFRWSSEFRCRSGLKLFDILIRGLARCYSLESVQFNNRASGHVSNDSIAGLMTARSLRSLQLCRISDWTAIAKGLGRTTCRLKKLALTRDDRPLIGVMDLATALEMNTSLQELVLHGKIDIDLSFVHLSKVLGTKQTLRYIGIDFFCCPPWSRLRTSEELIQPILDATKSNFDLRVHLAFCGYFSEVNNRIIPLLRDLHIQVTLNKNGRGKLLRQDSTRQDWIDAFVSINNIKEKSDTSAEMRDWQFLAQSKPDIEWDCLYLLLRSNPSLCERPRELFD